MTTFYAGDDGFDHAPPIDPNDELDYTLDVADVLGVGDTIASVQWIIAPTGALEVFSQSNTDTTATVWLRTPTLGEEYLVTARFTSASVPPRKFDKSFKILCKQR